MNWIIGVSIVAGILAWWGLMRRPLIAEATAREKLARGALVIDVRTPREFESSRVPEAINIPLDELEKHLSEHVTNKQQVLLVHCLTGTRSGLAMFRLQGMGYPNVFNLGSLARAKRIVAGWRKPA